ncbi:MAG: amidohydrolase family protein [Actinobacteria bacterium]|nr:amidohydrolase family protein [Actinomycetota bacterium]
MDLLLRNAVLLGTDHPVDVLVSGGTVAAIGPDLPAPDGEHEVEDLAGRLVTPPLVEPHIHLDAVLTVGQPRQNETGSLFEGIAVWAERVRTLTPDDVAARAREVMTWQLAWGVQSVRSHVDVCDPDLRALAGLKQVREEFAGLVDLQLVAFPQQGIYGFAGGADLMRRAVEEGCDVVGGIPHYELTREDGVASVQYVFDLAQEYDRLIDIHCDETDDDHARFVEVMAAETIKRGMTGRVTASHTTAMGSYNAAYAYRLVNNIRRAGLHMVTNPLDNSVLQGRFDVGPVRRGQTRVKELIAAGLNVAIGHDSVMDPWYPLGVGDPLQSAFVMAHYGQMSGASELEYLLEMVTTNPAKALGVDSAGIRVGGPADLVVFDAPTATDAVRRISPRWLVMRAGEVVARTRPATTTVTTAAGTREVTFLRP